MFHHESSFSSLALSTENFFLKSFSGIPENDPFALWQQFQHWSHSLQPWFSPECFLWFYCHQLLYLHSDKFPFVFLNFIFRKILRLYFIQNFLRFYELLDFTIFRWKDFLSSDIIDINFALFDTFARMKFLQPFHTHLIGSWIIFIDFSLYSPQGLF